MHNVMYVLRNWFLLGWPIAVLADLSGMDQTLLGSIWLLATGLPLAAMAVLQPRWLCRWLIWPLWLLGQWLLRHSSLPVR